MDIEQIGAKLERLRVEEDLTRAGIGKMLGVTAMTIWRIERGGSFRPKTVTRYAALLGVRLFCALEQVEPGE